MARRRFFVEAIERGHAQITGEQAQHLARVLRVEPGERFEISDNRGLYLAEVESSRKDLVSFAVLETMDVPAAVVHATLLASLTKFDRFEWAIEKATEVGVERIIPIVSERSEKGLEQAAGKRLARWKRIVRESSEQARRDRMPELEAPISLAAALAVEASYRFMLAEGEAPPILAALPDTRDAGDRVALLVGPEGGWTERERAMIAAANWTAVSLGRTILRAETAATVGLAIIHAAWAAGGS